MKASHIETCLNCGVEIKQSTTGRKRKFCCDKCRIAYHRLAKRYPNLQKDVTKRASNTYHEPDTLHLKPITLRQANAFVDEHHSHHIPVTGHKFSIGAVVNGHLVGVVIVGRPVSRSLDDGFTAEVTRCATNRTRHAASKLMAAAWRAAKAMGYMRIVSYTLYSESGASLAAAGYVKVEKITGKSWNSPSRRRTDKHPTCDKWRWEISR